jgi:hypothetical protein
MVQCISFLKLSLADMVSTDWPHPDSLDLGYWAVTSPYFTFQTYVCNSTVSQEYRNLAAWISAAIYPWVRLMYMMAALQWTRYLAYNYYNIPLKP